VGYWARSAVFARMRDDGEIWDLIEMGLQF
jgi:hypothetical protein